MKDPEKYELRGVSASKSDVHKAIKGLDKGLYPLAFCKVLPDIGGQDDAYVNVMHADTAGTKTSLAYIYWKETGDTSVWRGIAQDAIVMNVDDMACVGIVNDILLSSTIGRNRNLIPGEVIAEIIQGAQAFVQMLHENDIKIHMSGGETADVGDIVRTIDVGYTTYARIRKDKLIVNNMQDGNVIVGLASYGQSTYEESYNSGMGSNGLTSARHDVLSSEYREKYPESYDGHTPKDLVYSGRKKLTDQLDLDGNMIDIGKLILSPTRTYMPLIKKIMDNYHDKITGIIHNTGGAHTKVKKFAPNRKIVKNNLLMVPPLFELIREESGTDYRDMFQVFNMGTRLEIYTDEVTAQGILDISAGYNIDAQVIGHVEASDSSEVELHHQGKVYSY